MKKKYKLVVAQFQNQIKPGYKPLINNKLHQTFCKQSKHQRNNRQTSLHDKREAVEGQNVNDDALHNTYTVLWAKHRCMICEMTQQ